MKNKKQITTAIIQSLQSKSIAQQEKNKDPLYSWWYTGRSGQGLRLTDEGMHKFKEADIEYYEFPLNLEKENFQKMMLIFGKKIDCPFYVGFNNRSYKSAYIRIYDSKIAMMINLYGDVEEYIKSK